MAEATRIIGTFAANTKVQIAKLNASVTAFRGISALKGMSLGIVAVAAALLGTLAPAIRFEAAFANVAKTVDGTPEQLLRLRSSILDMSREMPLAADEIARVAATAGQLGVRVADIETFTETMVQLGTATDLTADQAAIALARFTNIMQVPIRQLPLLAAGLVELGNNSAATESEILNLGLRLAGAGDQIGLSGVQTLALSAAMRSLGITAEAGGSSVSRVLIDMVTASGPKMEKFAEVIGMTSTEFRNLVKERSPEAAAKLVVGFVQGLNRVDKSGGNVRQVLKDLGLDSIRLRDALFRLTGGSQEVVKAFGLVSQESQYGGALLAEYGRFVETTSSRIQILRNRVTALAIDIGTPLLGGTVAMVDSLGDGIVKLNGLLAPAGNDIREFMSALGEVGGVIATTFGPAVLGVAQGAILGVADSLGLLLSVLSAGGGFGLAGIAIAALVADLLLVGPASVAASRGLVALAGSVGGLTAVGRTVAGIEVVTRSVAAGTVAMRLALMAAPWAALAAAAYLYYKALRDVREAAEGAGDAVRDSLNRALENNDAEGFARSIDRTKSKIEELGNAGSTAEQKFGSFWGKTIDWRASVFFGDRLDETTQKVREMQKALDEVEAEQLSAGFEAIAHILGVTSDEVAAAASELDLYEDVIKAGKVTLNDFNLGLDEQSIGFIGVTDAIRDHIIVAETLADGSLQAYMDELDISFASLIRLAAEAGISMNDLTDDKRYGENIRAIAPLVDKYQELADAAGTSREAAELESQALLILRGSYQQLSEAIKEATATREAGAGQRKNLEQAAEAYEAVKAQFIAGEASAEAYARATYNLETAIATSGLTAEQAAIQNAILAGEFASVAREAGESEETISRLLVDWIALTATEVANFEIQGLETLALAQERVESLKLVLADEIVAKMAVERGTTVEDMQNMIDRGNTWHSAEFKARFEAAIEQPLEAIARILVEKGVWDETEAEAFLLLNIDPAEANRIRMEENLRAMTEGRWMAILDADGTPADLSIAGAVAGATGFATGPYDAPLTATDDASTTIAKPQKAVDDYAGETYNPPIEATDEASSVIAKPQDAANEFHTGIYKPPIDVENKASGIISQIQREIDMLRGKTVQVQAVFSTVGQTQTQAAVSGFQNYYRRSTQVADGGMFSSAGVRRYANGGFENHQAMIAPGRWPVRVWAEPETGGEAYIPLGASKRPRSERILNVVAQDFGYKLMPMADGGLLGLLRHNPFSSVVNYTVQQPPVFNLSAPVSVVISGTGGADPEALSREVRARVTAALDTLGRDLLNMRVSP